MLDWYHLFLACVLLLWIASTPRDRNALRILLIATLLSEVVVEGFTRQISGAWKLVVPGAVETITLAAMCQWSKNRTGYLQCVLLLIAWLSHVLCYVDYTLKTDLVYSRYELILQAVAVGQLAACYDTISHIIGRVSNWVGELRAFGSRGVPTASLATDDLHSARTPGGQTTR